MVTKVLMVCLGNICRSPLAEGILKNKVDHKFVFVDSAGTAGYHVGNKPDKRSIAVAKKYGIDISDQRCRKFEIIDFDHFDSIYVMDKSNYADIIAKSRNNSDQSKVKLLLDDVSLNFKEIPDPYHDNQQGFENVYHLIDVACEVIATKLKTT